MPSRYFHTMGHTKATPENQRPTIEELEAHNLYAQKHTRLNVLIRGLWQDSEASFEVQVKGDFDDIIEVFESLKDNGNLMGIEMHELDRNESGAGKS